MTNLPSLFRQMFWVSVAVIAATGNASASSSAEESVRTRVDALANAAIASANKNDCVSAGKYAAKITAFLKQNQISISAFENTHTDIEQEMQNTMVRTLGAIRLCEMRASASTSPPRIPPPVQRAPQPAPNSVTPPTMAASGAAPPQTEQSGSRDDLTSAAKGPIVIDGVSFSRASVNTVMENSRKSFSKDPDFKGDPKLIENAAKLATAMALEKTAEDINKKKGRQR